VSQPTFTPRGPERVRRIAWRPSTVLAFTPTPLASFSPLGRHTKYGRLGADGLRGWSVGWLGQDGNGPRVYGHRLYVQAYVRIHMRVHVRVRVYANASFPCWAMILYLPVV